MFYTLGDDNGFNLKRLDTLKIKHIKSTLEMIDKNKNGFIDKYELAERLLDVYR